PANDAGRGAQGRHRLRRPRPPPRRRGLAPPRDEGRLRRPRRARRDALALPLPPGRDPPRRRRRRDGLGNAVNPLDHLVPPGLPAPETAEDDPRLGRWLAASRRLTDRTRDVRVRFPSDEGVRRSGGRPGAALGPHAFREALYRLTPDLAAPEAFTALLDRAADLGDVQVSGDVEADQERLGDVVGALL